MSFHCPNFFKATVPPISARRIAGAGLISVATLCLAACSREDRDFNAGGPNRIPAKEMTSSATQGHYSAMEGPQFPMEGNAYALTEGKRLYSSFNCIGCHSAGGGDIGPALMDAKWIYGAKPQDIYVSIMDGRPNGMPAFRGRITETQALQLTAYVRSLSGQAKMNAATGRDDHMRTAPAENSLDRETPAPAPPPQ